MSSTLVWIVVCVVSLGVGIWLGLPGRWDQSLEDIDQSLDERQGRERPKKRAVSPLAWVQRKAQQSELRNRGQRRRGLNLESPDDDDR